MILYFSGTGNSHYAAEAISRALAEEPVSINEYMKKGEYPELTSESPWLIAAPTYAWRLPKVVEEFIRRSTFHGNREVRFVLTCGDSIGNAGAYAKELCEEKGLVYRGMADLVMPENYITLFKAPDEKEEQSIMKEADQRLQEIIEDLQAGRDLTQRCGRQKLLSAIVNPCFYPLFVKAGPYYAKENCNGCGFCEEICPLGNIRIKEGKPVWGNNCTQCMACICGCPSEAIEYGKKSRGKRRYLCKPFDKRDENEVK